MSEELSGVLAVMATKLGTTVEHLWVVMVKQAPIQAVSEIAIVATFTIVTLKVLNKSCKKLNDDTNDIDSPWVVAVGISAVLLMILLICILFSFSDWVTAFLNPEYWALDHLLAKVKKK